MPMQQTAPSTLPTTSMSMSGSSHGTGPGYSHAGPSQSVSLQGQGAMGSYVSRANINMQSNPGMPQVPCVESDTQRNHLWEAGTPHSTRCGINASCYTENSGQVGGVKQKRR